MKRTPPPENYRGMLWLSTIALLVCIIMPVASIDKARGVLLISPESYRTTVGTIVRSAIVPEMGRGVYYYYDIAYRYTVDGKTYTSTCVTFGETSDEGQWFAKKYVHKYPLGKHVPVLYLPNQPDFSVLEPNEVGFTKVVMAIKVIMIAMVLAVVLWCYRGLQRQKQQAAQN